MCNQVHETLVDIITICRLEQYQGTNLSDFQMKKNAWAYLYLF